MHPSRRQLLGLLGAGSASGFAGCVFGYQEPDSDNQDITDHESRHFNENGELTSPVNNESIDTREVNTTPIQRTGTSAPDFDRQLWSRDDITVTVPGDYNTIQAAIDDCPTHLYHDYIIKVEDGTYDEDIFIQGIHDAGFASSDTKNFQLWIIGNRSNPENVALNTVTAVGCTGVETPKISGVSLGGETPYEDQPTSFCIYGCTEGFISDSEFRGGARDAVTAYASRLHLRKCDLGVENYQRGIFAKREATISTNENTGTVTEYPYLTFQNGTIAVQTMDTFLDTSSDEIDRFNPKNGVVYFGGAGPTWEKLAIHNYGGENVFRDRVGDQAFVFHNTASEMDNKDIFRIQGKGWGNRHIENLSGQSGDFDGQIRLDDGSNTSNRGIPCTWDDEAGEWVPHDGDKTFS